MNKDIKEYKQTILCQIALTEQVLPQSPKGRNT